MNRIASRCSTFQMEIAGTEPALEDLARRGADHATKGTREVRSIGEPRHVCGCEAWASGRTSPKDDVLRRDSNYL